MTKLIDLDPGFVGYGGEGITKADGSAIPRREGIGVSFNCPCGGKCRQRVFLNFENPMDGGPFLPGHNTWKRKGGNPRKHDVDALDPAYERVQVARVFNEWRI